MTTAIRAEGSLQPPTRWACLESQSTSVTQRTVTCPRRLSVMTQVLSQATPLNQYDHRSEAVLVPGAPEVPVGNIAEWVQVRPTPPGRPEMKQHEWDGSH